jgi:DNA mismatch endonuclease (patch repair protein)
MTDTLSKSQRSKRMSLIRGKDTGPERQVRSLVHSMGFRFSLRRNHVPGKPDILFPSQGKAIFVHGCFWHRHADPKCRLARLPKSRLDFWLPKLEANRIRDIQKQKELRASGWAFLVVWECEIGHTEHLKNKLKRFLERDNARGRTVRRSGGARDRNK